MCELHKNHVVKQNGELIEKYILTLTLKALKLYKSDAIKILSGRQELLNELTTNIRLMRSYGASLVSQRSKLVENNGRKQFSFKKPRCEGERSGKDLDTEALGKETKEINATKTPTSSIDDSKITEINKKLAAASMRIEQTICVKKDIEKIFNWLEEIASFEGNVINERVQSAVILCLTNEIISIVPLSEIGCNDDIEHHSSLGAKKVCPNWYFCGNFTSEHGEEYIHPKTCNCTNNPLVCLMRHKEYKYNITEPLEIPEAIVAHYLKNQEDAHFLRDCDRSDPSKKLCEHGAKCNMYSKVAHHLYHETDKETRAHMAKYAHPKESMAEHCGYQQDGDAETHFREENEPAVGSFWKRKRFNKKQRGGREAIPDRHSNPVTWDPNTRGIDAVTNCKLLLGGAKDVYNPDRDLINGVSDIIKGIRPHCGLSTTELEQSLQLGCITLGGDFIGGKVLQEVCRKTVKSLSASCDDGDNLMSEEFIKRYVLSILVGLIPFSAYDSAKGLPDDQEHLDITIKGIVSDIVSSIDKTAEGGSWRGLKTNSFLRAHGLVPVNYGFGKSATGGCVLVFNREILHNQNTLVRLGKLPPACPIGDNDDISNYHSSLLQLGVDGTLECIAHNIINTVRSEKGRDPTVEEIREHILYEKSQTVECYLPAFVQFLSVKAVLLTKSTYKGLGARTKRNLERIKGCFGCEVVTDVEDEDALVERLEDYCVVGEDDAERDLSGYHLVLDETNRFLHFAMTKGEQPCVGFRTGDHRLEFKFLDGLRNPLACLSVDHNRFRLCSDKEKSDKMKRDGGRNTGAQCSTVIPKLKVSDILIRLACDRLLISCVDPVTSQEYMATALRLEKAGTPVTAVVRSLGPCVVHRFRVLYDEAKRFHVESADTPKPGTSLQQENSSSLAHQRSNYADDKPLIDDVDGK